VTPEHAYRNTLQQGLLAHRPHGDFDTVLTRLGLLVGVVEHIDGNRVAQEVDLSQFQTA